MKQQGKSINPANLQEFLDTAANAHEGQQQFFTDPEISAALAIPLGRVNGQGMAAVDLQMGRGDLLRTIGTDHLLGIDIDAAVARKPNGADGHWSVYQADCHQWYDLAVQANFVAEIFTLNPPFGLQWHTERVKQLGESRIRTIRELYAHVTAGKTTIDSTLATLMMAIDRCSYCGEGYLIMNADTLDKWIERAQSQEPWANFVRHIWATLRIPGPIWQNQLTAFHTAVLYFTKHVATRAVTAPHTITADSHVRQSISQAARTAAEARHSHYPSPSSHWPDPKTLIAWDAIRKEITRLRQGTTSKSEYNIYLDEDGRLCRYLSTFETLTDRIPGKLIQQLDELKGKRPLQLVVQTAQRKALIEATRHPAWRVDPAVIEAVNAAIAQYEAARAPFFQPNPIQSLGWIDELDRIKCTRSIPGSRFQAGESYPISTKTESTSWNATKTNDMGEADKLRMYGAELAVIIFESPDVDKQRTPDGDLYAHHTFHIREHNPQRDETYPPDTQRTKHHHVATLLEHFEIPRPRDVAQLNPEQYQENMKLLTQVEDYITRKINAA